MKAIVSCEVNGQFAEVGTMNRTLVERKKFSGIHKAAKRYAGRRAYRIEYFFGETIYGNADLVQTYPQESAR